MAHEAADRHASRPGNKSPFWAILTKTRTQPKAAAARLLEETGKEASPDTFKRVLKKRLCLETLSVISEGEAQ